VEEPPPPAEPLSEPPPGEPPVPPTGPSILSDEKGSTDGGNRGQFVVYGIIILIFLVSEMGGQMGETVAMVIFGITITFGLLFMACLGIWFIRRSMKTKNWKPTKATFQMSEPYETIDYKVRQPEGNFSPVRMYKIDVSYDYLVGGRVYKGTYYSIENPHCMFKQKRSCDMIAKHYEGRTEAVIYYSDSDPEDAILVRKNLSVPVLISCIILIPTFLCTGIGGIYYFFNLLIN